MDHNHVISNNSNKNKSVPENLLDGNTAILKPTFLILKSTMLFQELTTYTQMTDIQLPFKSKY